MITEQTQGREAPAGASSYPIKNQRQDIKCLAFKIKSGPDYWYWNYIVILPLILPTIIATN